MFKRKKNKTATGNEPKEGGVDATPSIEEGHSELTEKPQLDYFTPEMLQPPSEPDQGPALGDGAHDTLPGLLNRERSRFWMVFSFILWPVSPLLIVAYGLFTRLRSRGTAAPRKVSVWQLLGFWLYQPVYLLSLARRRRNLRLVLAICLLLPLFLATLWGSYVLIFSNWDDFARVGPSLQSPLHHLPMGTDGQGRGLFTQIAAGGRHSYFTSLLAVLFAVTIGVFTGRASDNQRLDSALAFGAQLIETIPLLFLFMVLFALFSDWSSGLPGTNARDSLRILILGLGLGVSFSPPIFRLIRDRIRRFKSEDFVNATKAHGISQSTIIWRHIIGKNSTSDIMILAAQIWGFAMLMEISLSYVFSIGSAKLGGEPYDSWAWMLLTPESKNALIGNVDSIAVNWWVWFFPAFFIAVTIVGFYLFGEALKQWRSRHEQFRLMERPHKAEELWMNNFPVNGGKKTTF
ncbi:MAG: ABC transporter permease [bacterium]